MPASQGGVGGAALTAPVPTQYTAAMLAYKVVETSSVDEETLESIINQWVRQGWAFDGMQFAMRDSSKRPAMAFLLFTRQEPAPAPEA